jgi:AcrR family transcriptional regulator
MLQVSKPKRARSAKRGQLTLDPRIAHSRQRVLAAALEELGEAGYGAFAIESVSARSGVAKSTIYRHWPDKLALIADAFQSHHQDEAPDLDSGSVRERVARVVAHVAVVVGHSPFAACIPALIEGAERDARLRKFHHQFQVEARRPLVALIADGVKSGDFPAYVDPELAALALIGAIFYQRLASPRPLEPTVAATLVDALLPRGPVSRRPASRPASRPAAFRSRASRKP